MNEKTPNSKNVVNLEEYRAANAAKKQRMAENLQLPLKVVEIKNSYVPPNTGKTYRNFFIFLFVLFSFAILVFLYDENELFSIDTTLCQSKINEDGSKEVIFDKEPNGHYTCGGYINGKEVKFILDTGATHVTVPEKYQAFLGLRSRRSGYADTANGRVLVYSTVIRNITIGHISISRVPGTISTGMEMDAVLLGMSFLEKVKFQFSGNQLILRQ
jgi:aspartyl protease family protein